MTRRIVLLVALVVGLLGAGYALLPVPDSSSRCGPAAVEAFKGGRRSQGTGNLFALLAANPCQKRAKNRLYTSGVVIGLAALGAGVGARIVREELPI